MSTVFIFLLSLVAGYYISLIFSHPNKKKHLLPHLQYRNIEFTPNLRIHFRNKTYWFHHWIYCSIVACALFIVLDNFSQLALLKGVALGGVFQGLRYPDRFKFRHPRVRQ